MALVTSIEKVILDMIYNLQKEKLIVLFYSSSNLRLHSESDYRRESMLGLSYPAETVLCTNNSRNRIFLQFLDIPRTPLGL